MAIVPLASTKGGVGKSTTVVSLAAMAWAAGASVAVFDLDPQHHSRDMLEMLLKRLPADVKRSRKELNIHTEATALNLLEQLSEADEQYDLVLVDLQGSANEMMLLSLAKADLVIMPVQASKLDIGGVLSAWKSLERASSMGGRKVEYRVFFVRTPAAIRPRVLKDARRNFEEKGLKVLDCEFVERTEFKQMTFTGEFPTEFAPRSKAAENVKAIYTEVMTVLQDVMEKAA